jgi:hypothetical protein
MGLRRAYVLLLCLGALASTAASYRTPHFVVEAPTPQVAQQIGQAADRYRREKALEWLGQEMAPWPEPCPLKVTVTLSGAGGATSFAFDRGRVLGQHMHIEGSLDRLLNSVLPHEVTHTVFAYHFRQPVPRWADEGGAVLSEDEVERNRHDLLVRQILNSGRAIPLRRLFALKEYPSDVMALYAQGYSVTHFLVANSSKPAFLNFVAHGIQHGWDHACQTHYRYRNVEELEQAWLSHLRATRRPPAQLAAAPAGNGPATAMVRTTVPPEQPTFVPDPIVRGQTPEETPARPAFLPETYPPASARPPERAPPQPSPWPPPAPPAAWPPSGGRPNQWQPAPPNVRLQPPQFGPPGFGPAGYPH